MSRPRRHVETHRPRVELVVQDPPAWKRWQLLQLERARPDEEKRRTYDRSESTIIGACVVGSVAIAFVLFMLWGGLGCSA